MKSKMRSRSSDGVRSESQAQSDFLPGLHAMMEAAHGAVEAPFDSAKLIMHAGIGAIQADADVGEFQLLESFWPFPRRSAFRWC